MKRFIGQSYVLVASDIVHDGLGVELWDNEHNLIAEVFRCDVNNTVLFNTFNNGVPLSVLQSFAQFAREKLEPFEDGSLLPKAEPVIVSEYDATIKDMKFDWDKSKAATCQNMEFHSTKQKIFSMIRYMLTSTIRITLVLRSVTS